jgi:HK97 family phage prohead protease
MSGIETKRASPLVTRSTLAGVIEGYASLFGVADSGGDIVQPGAFARSLAQRGAAGVKMLWQHNAAEPIGVWSSIVEDAKGLKVTGRLDLSVARAREGLSLIRSGAVDGLSIGFRTRRASTSKATGLRRLFDIDLWEISVVTFPMQTGARIDAVKRAPARGDAGLQGALSRLAAQQAARQFQHGLQRLARSG